MHPQQSIHNLSLHSPQSFWSHHASHLHWHRPPTQAVTKHPKTTADGASYDHWAWFPDGEISTTYNCVDRHVRNGHGDRAAIIWDSPVTGAKETFSYARLLDEVEVLAGVLREEGVKKGDVVIIYSTSAPLITLTPPVLY